MRSPRWQKLLRDLSVERGRVFAMIAAVVVSLAAVGAVLGAYAVLSREIAVNYLGTRPASATLELPGGVDRALVEAVRRRPEIAEAEARDTLLARVRVGEDWRPLLIFAVDGFTSLRLNTFRAEAGAWPPPDGAMLVERTAVSMLEAGPGQVVRLKTPHGVAREVPIVGTVHDPGLAPAWQERMGYAYVTRATLAALGEPPVLHELRIEVRERPRDRDAIVAAATALARDLEAQGHPVHEVRVPAPGRHPHQLQMVTILLMLVVFAALALVLSAVLVASSLAAMLARQVREIGIMKAIGATTGQLAGLYVAFIAAIGAAATLLAWPLGFVGARAQAGAVARLLNLELTSRAIPSWVAAVQLAAGLVVPLVLAAIPIARASRMTVRGAIDEHGVGAVTLRPVFSRLPQPLRNALRRPARLALTLLLLGAGGAMFMCALNLRASWIANLDKFRQARSYDLEVRLQRPEPIALADRLRRVPGVRTVEAWGYAPTSIMSPGQLEVSASYPDGRHAVFAFLAPPPSTALVRFPVLEGRWLTDEETDAVVLNHAARAQVPGARVGERVTLSLDGRPTRWRLVGVVEEVGYTPVAYVADRAFARAADLGDRARMLRVATDGADRLAILRAVEEALAGVGIEQAVPLAEHRTAVGDHIVILIRSLVAMAIVMAIVGALGLASAMGVSVVERTREVGVMKAIGATPGRVMRDVVLEALGIAVVSWALALLLSLPLTAYVDRLIGGLGFLSSLPLLIVPAAAAIWLGIVALVAIAATWLPARRAALVPAATALAHT